MPTGNKITFVDLITDYRISIPTIQRDYVQGRQDKKTEDVRKGLVDNIINNLLRSEPCHLNFTVGVIPDNNDSVFLLDGQQRITTLFLLYYYVAFRAGKRSYFAQLVKYDSAGSDEKRFEYFTRYTTQRFLDALVTQNENFLPNKTIGQNIRESNWYSPDYEDDVSIKSMFVIFDMFDKKLKDANFNDLFDKLFNKRLLTFFFLLDDKIEKPHEHYIKINSRGKDLTDFELFKSAFFEKMDSYVESTVIDEDLDKEIREHINFEWYEFLWNNFGIREEAGKKTDDLFRLLIHSLFLSISLSRKPEAQANKVEKDFETLLYTFGYDDQFAKEYCHYLSELFKLLKFIKDNDVEFYKYYINPAFVNDANNIVVTQHPSKTFIFALSHYAYSLRGIFNLNEAKSFISLIRNVIYNDDDIDGIEKVAKRCINFRTLDERDFANIDQNLINKLNSFNKVLLQEELEKKELVDKQDDTSKQDDIRAAIFNAEKQLPFFNGRIAFALRLSLNSQDELDLTVFDNVIKKSEFFKDGDAAGSLSFTWCGTPIVYKLTNGSPSVTINGKRRNGTILTAAETADLFARNGKIKNITVEVRL